MCVPVFSFSMHLVRHGLEKGFIDVPGRCTQLCRRGVESFVVKEPYKFIDSVNVAWT